MRFAVAWVTLLALEAAIGFAIVEAWLVVRFPGEPVDWMGEFIILGPPMVFMVLPASLSQALVIHRAPPIVPAIWLLLATAVGFGMSALIFGVATVGLSYGILPAIGIAPLVVIRLRGGSIDWHAPHGAS
jgi:hypothetical protein